MAVKAGSAYVDIEGDFSALNKQVATHFKNLDTQAGGMGKRIGSKLGHGIATGVRGATRVGAVGVGLLTAEVIRATKGWADHEAIVRRSNAVVKSTGGAANVSAKHVGRLADALERQVGVDGDLIQSGANLLLTFTNIRNGVGKNNKIFDEATKTTVNMSKALGQDTKSSAIQLGKALNDPVKGITALQRVGVSFNAQQKETIKALVGTGNALDDLKTVGVALTSEQKNQINVLGDLADPFAAVKDLNLELTDAQKKQLKAMQDGSGAMKAQKIILKELGKEFPKVKATPFERLVAVGRQVEDTIGKAVLPAFNKLVRQVTPGLQRIADKFDKILGDKNLTVGEKLSKMFAAVDVEVDPLIDNIVEKIREAHLDERLKKLAKDGAPELAEGFKEVGGTAAGALWEGFKAAPLWTKVLGAGFVAKALFGGGGRGGGMGGIGSRGGSFGVAGGLAARAFKTAFEAGAIKLSTGSGLTAKVATFFTGRGTTPANPLFVADVAGGLGGGKGPGGGPIPVPGGKGILGKLKGAAKFGGKLAAAGAALDFGINLVDSHGNPIAATINTAHDLTFGITPKVEVKTGKERQDEQFRKVSEQIDKMVSEGNISGMKRLADETEKLAHPWAEFGDQTVDQKYADLNEQLRETVKLAEQGIHIDFDDKDAVRAAKRVGDSMERMRSGSSRSIGSLKTNVRMQMRAIKRTLGEDSAAGKEAISANFSAAIENIKTSMSEGTISVKDGTALIQQYMVNSLMNFGFSKKQALNIAKDPTRRTSFIGGPEEGTRGPGHGQHGGYVFNGAASGDSVHALLEKDEYVLNRKAVKKVGKAALDRLNFGIAPRFQRGGSVSGDTDVLPGMLDRLRRLSAAAGVPIFISSGRRTLQEQALLYREKGAYSPTNPGAAAPSPNAPHVRGIAADITPGVGTLGRLAARFGLYFPMANEPWHIQLMDAAITAAGQAVSVVAEKIAGVRVAGPDSALRTISQRAIDITQGAAQGVVNSVANNMSVQPEFGENPVSGGGVTGNGSGLMRLISKQRGWNFPDWWALDASETSHGANLSNPTSTARLRGQFLSGNYGKYGPGSDPSQNPTMAQQIYSMARYIAERYGNPTRAWAFHQAHNWYQRGGSVNVKKLTKLIRRGPVPSGQAIKKVVSAIGKTSKKGKLAGAGKTLRRRLIDRIRGLGLPDSVKDLVAKEALVNRYDDLQSHAGTLTDSGVIQEALEAQQQKLGRDLTPAEQDATILSMLGRVQGKTQIEWLAEELGALGSWRNALIRVHITLRDRLQKFSASIEAAKKRRDSLHKAIINARDKRASLQKQLKGSKGAKRDRLNGQIKGLDKDIKVWTLEYTTLSGPNGVIPRLSDKREVFRTALTDADTDLSEVQGSVASGDKYQQFSSLQGLAIGRLLGNIFEVQNALRTSGISSYRIPASDTQTPDTADDPSKEILQQLLREANLRTAVSEAQFAVFKNLPFGGFFDKGGTVPGPVGAARMIVAHGGEVVVPGDAGYVPHVSVHFANGMEWLGRFVDIRVDNQTRAQGRRSERQLPGRPGVLR
jgi:hypothetical protein